MENKEEIDTGFVKSAKRAWSYNADKERIINRLQNLAVEKSLNMENCQDIADVYEKHFCKNTSSNSDYAKSKNCANCSKLYQCNDARRHFEWHCEKHDFA